MKKILFVMPSLDSGGAEKSLVNLLNIIDYKKYNIDLLLLKQEGLFLNQIPKEVNLLPLTDSLQYAYKVNKSMFNSFSGMKSGMLVRLYVNYFIGKMQGSRDGLNIINDIYQI